MKVVHNYEQIMAWKPDDLRALIGSHVAPREPADDRTFWADPHGYPGEWQPLASGVVTDIVYDTNSGGYSGQLIYADGGWFGWLSGQPISITETKES